MPRRGGVSTRSDREALNIGRNLLGRRSAEIEVRKRSVALRVQLGSLVAVGGVLGVVIGEPAARVVAAVVWAVATALGCMVGSLAFLAFADFFLSRGEDDDFIGRLAGGWVMTLFLILGAVGMWTFLGEWLRGRGAQTATELG